MNKKNWILIIFILSFLIGFLFFRVVTYLSPPEWKMYQSRYFSSMSQLNKLDFSFSRGIISRKVEVTGKVEKCVTCHLGVVFSPLSFPPFKTHPETGCPVPVLEAGCTTCHMGEGLKLSVRGAHGMDKFAILPLIDWKSGKNRKFNIQAGCSLCHYQFINGIIVFDKKIVPDVADGMEVFISNGCPSCHKIEGIYSFRNFAPDLKWASMRMKTKELKEFLRNPQKDNYISPMPPVQASTAELNKLVVFLKAIGRIMDGGIAIEVVKLKHKLHRINVIEHFEESIEFKSSVEEGKYWFGKIGCSGCHSLEEGQKRVPDLRYEGFLRRREFLYDILTVPEECVPGTYMPDYDLPEEITESIIEFLMWQRRELPAESDAILAQICFKCHGEEAKPYVSIFTVKPPVFDNNFKGKISESDFLLTLKEGRSGTAMAPWGRFFSQRQIKDLYEHFK